MRTLSGALTAEQIKANLRTPLIKLEVATYGHPAAVTAANLQWSGFAWERLTAADDATTLGLHCVATPADGSVIRFRMDGDTTAMKIQRVASPGIGSDWTTWTSFGTAQASSPVALAARGAAVIAFCSNGTYIYRRESADSGATWGSWTAMTNTRACERGLAACYKSNGDCAVIAASDANDPTSLYFYKRVSGTWTSDLGQISGDFPISALAMYHDGDWNILALVLDGSYVRLARAIMGDGDQYAVGTFSGFEFINSTKAKVDIPSQMALRQFRKKRPGRYIPTYYEMVSAIIEARAADNLGVDDPYLCYHASLGAVYSFARDNRPWFFRLKPGSEFRDSDWHRAYPLDITTTYGLALGCDGTYLYAACPDQVWRTALPGSWTPPTIGSGAGTFYSVPSAHVLRVSEQVASLAPSTLIVALNNSTGEYNVLGGGASLKGSLKRGSTVRLSIGYKTDSDLLSVCGQYFIESLEYSRKPGKSFFTIHCIDAWALLEKYGFNKPVEWNAYTNEFTVYALIEKVVQAVGGTLSYKSRSSYITAIYPHLEVTPGQNGAALLSRLLSLVPDTIFFVGLTGYIVYPQATDSVTYHLRFPT